MLHDCLLETSRPKPQPKPRIPAPVVIMLNDGQASGSGGVPLSPQQLRLVDRCREVVEPKEGASTSLESLVQALGPDWQTFGRGRGVTKLVSALQTAFGKTAFSKSNEPRVAFDGLQLLAEPTEPTEPPSSPPSRFSSVASAAYKAAAAALGAASPTGAVAAALAGAVFDSEPPRKRLKKTTLRVEEYSEEIWEYS